MPETLQQGTIIPDFTLDDIHGNTVSSRSFYMRRILVVALVPDPVSPSWTTWLGELSSAMKTVDESDAVCLVILPPDFPQEISALDSGDERVRFLVDSKGTGRERFQLPSSTGQLLVTNRHGVVYHIAAGDPGEPGFAPNEVPGWVEFVACQCS